MEQKIQEWQLKQRQGLPLKAKIERSKLRIREFYEHYEGMVYVAFSGGKDSTVLLHIVRSMYPEVPAVFVDTGLEFPEIRNFVKQTSNVVWLKPEMNFKKVLETCGYPVISKKNAKMIRVLQNPHEKNEVVRKLYLTGMRKDGTKLEKFKLPDKWHRLIDAPFKISEKCCDIMKKDPVHKYVKETGRYAIIGLMASDSHLRRGQYLMFGCNNFRDVEPYSIPMGFWLEKDVWSYIGKYDVPYSKIYDMGYDRTGCIFCMFGVHMENPPNRFQLLAKTHPKQYNYCMNKLGLKEVLEYIGVDYKPLTTLDDF